MDGGDCGGSVKVGGLPWKEVAPPWGCRSKLPAIVVSASLGRVG